MTIRPKYFRKNASVKSVDILAKEWFDRVNGNSYFAAVVTVNDKIRFSIPFTYGYGNYSQQRALEILEEQGIADKSFLRGSNLVNFTKQENCLNREVKAFGKSEGVQLA